MRLSDVRIAEATEPLLLAVDPPIDRLGSFQHGWARLVEQLGGKLDDSVGLVARGQVVGTRKGTDRRRHSLLGHNQVGLQGQELLVVPP